ncbi:PucR family transcriptional regulator ligand-binding domain-containing protein [Streptomyces sp. B1866]|uniref:PucR family transcriptional regulator ligand-binding domain-containing protein n=1 Tax=Streptomyces sp. B1866 TaxID=3075431 RepID=UPI0028913B0E|nr:PucR family transcriptional regulator ligand-binding domain-containing protein [Streptomyces sp. B1866]MDT3398044.1 PucR family transcriptional regulator ligand-binding domain-containing protein [Streptomyces sp. B1866]
MRLRALLETDTLGLRLLGGEAELDRSVRGVMTTDLRDPSRYLSGGELVLTGLAWRRRPADSERFVRILAAAGVAGLAAGEAELGSVPGDLVAACARHRLPLFSVVEDVSFASITEHVVRQVSAERAGDLAAVVERHRRLVAGGPAGGGPEVALDLLRSDLDLRAWVLSPTGRRVAGPTGPDRRLTAAVRAELAGEHLAAVRARRRFPHRVRAADGVTYSLFPVGGAAPPEQAEAAERAEAAALPDWLLAVEADAGDWPEQRLDLLRGVARLIAVERDRRDAARAVRRRLAQEVVDLAAAGAPPAEIAARLRVTAPVLLPGLGAAPRWQVVVARVECGPDAAANGPLARALLEEILAGPEAAGAEPADRVAVGQAGGEAVALVALPGPPVAARSEAPEAAAREPDAPPVPGGAADGTAHPDALLAAVRAPLARGLGEDGRITLGLSAAVHSAEGLHGALEEARHARRVAAARPGRVCAAGHQQLASHVLLLPFVPDDVRRVFTSRLLDPLRDYDRRHRADLVRTLDSFLTCDGSWTRCAATLHVHVNTLRYRVARIEQLTGRDLGRLEDRLDFFLALRMT